MPVGTRVLGLAFPAGPNPHLGGFLGHLAFLQPQAIAAQARWMDAVESLATLALGRGSRVWGAVRPVFRERVVFGRLR